MTDPTAPFLPPPVQTTDDAGPGGATAPTAVNSAAENGDGAVAPSQVGRVQRSLVTTSQPEWAPTAVGLKWRTGHTIGLILIVVAAGAVNYFMVRTPVAFGITLGLLALFMATAGHGVVGLWRGVLIDERNRLSLARLQTTLWTILVLSGFITAALHNVRVGNNGRRPDPLDPAAPSAFGDPLDIDIPQELWMLLGISTTSLVASPLILSTKRAVPMGSAAAPQSDVAATTGTAAMTGEAVVAAATEAGRVREEEKRRSVAALARQGLPPEAVGIQGTIVVWHRPEDARPADLVQGDEVGNAPQLDLGKVQMLFFTLVLVFAYGASLADLFTATRGGISEFPGLSHGLVVLLGISNAGYLGNKAVPHSQR